MIELQGLRLPAAAKRTAVLYNLEKDELRMEIRDEMGRNASVSFTIGGVTEAEIFERCLAFRENGYLMVQATETGNSVNDTLARTTTRHNRRLRRNIIAKADYVVVTPEGLDRGERVRVTYRRSFLDRTEPVDMTIERQRAGLNNDVSFAMNSQFTEERPRALKDAKVVLPVGTGEANARGEGSEDDGEE